jgi:tRNA dimethylallyltransferase
MTADYNLIAIIGPTASGKTAFAAKLAHRLDGEVISADSRQVYRHMNIGTGKDYDDYQVEGYQVPVHLTDIVEPGYKYSVFEFQRDFIRVFNDIHTRKKFPVLCGGSGLYIDAATRGYRLLEVPRNEDLRRTLQFKKPDELSELLSSLKKLHNKTDTDTKEHEMRAIEIEMYYRENPGIHAILPDLRTLYIGIIYDRATERNRITERLKNRLEKGMVDEVRRLIASGINPDDLSYYGLEYRFITLYLEDRIDYQTMVSQLNTAIHQFAKRQRTWFRKMEREGCIIHWLDGEMTDHEKLNTVIGLLK